MSAPAFKRALGPIALLLLALAMASPDAQGALVIVSRESTIHHEGAVNDQFGIDPMNPPYSATSTTLSEFDWFFDNLDGLSLSATHTYGMDTNASQNSFLTFFPNLTVKSIYGLGDASSIATGLPPPPGGGSGKANSFFDVFFDVVFEPTDVNLSAMVSSSGPAGPHPIGKARFDLIQTDGVGFILPPIHLEDNAGLLYHNLTLGVGSYHLSLNAETSATTASPGLLREASWSVELSVVPEPSALGLLCLGLAGVVIRKRNHRAA